MKSLVPLTVSQLIGLVILTLAFSPADAQPDQKVIIYSSCTSCDDQIYFINGRWAYRDDSQVGVPFVPITEPVDHIKPVVVKGRNKNSSYYCDFNTLRKYDRAKEGFICSSDGWRVVKLRGVGE